MDKELSKKRLGRSPAYPSIDLKAAVGKAKKIYDAVGRREIHFDAALNEMGYSKRTGPALRAVAALTQYGLITKSGTKGDRKITLSERSLEIIQLPQSDERRKNALAQASLNPKIFEVLNEKYGEHLPNDETINAFIIHDKKYTPRGAGAIIKAYRATLNYSKLDNKADEDDITEEDETGQYYNSEHESTSPQDTSKFNKQQMPPHTQSLTIPLGNTSIPIPIGVNKADFELFLSTLSLWKGRIIDVEYPRRATWHNKDSDVQVIVIGEIKERDGVKHFLIQESDTSIPEKEIEFES